MRCPHCNQDIDLDVHDPGADRRERVTYFVSADADGCTYVKIGTTKSLATRMRDLRLACSVPLKYLGATDDVSERALQRKWRHLNMGWSERGKPWLPADAGRCPRWIKRPRAAGPREWFRATAELMAEVRSLVGFDADKRSETEE